ncbi:MAG: hypothetical protein U1A78_29550 [Polyangia bacterium]
MQHTPNTDKEFSITTAPVPEVGLGEAGSEGLTPARELSALLHRAGELAEKMGVELDAWMRAAWSAYVDARPGLREHIEDMQLMAQLTALRESGRMGQA